MTHTMTHRSFWRARHVTVHCVVERLTTAITSTHYYNYNHTPAYSRMTIDRTDEATTGPESVDENRGRRTNG